MGAAGTGSLWWPAAEAAVRAATGSSIDLGFAARPPDQPESGEDRDLQDDQQEEDRHESLHGLSLDARGWV
jgi:hypothetical protein